MVPPASHRVTRVRWYSGSTPLRSHFAYRTFTFFGLTFQSCSAMLPLIPSVLNPIFAYGLGSFPFARRYSENRCFFLFLRVLRCFSSPRCPLYGYVFTIGSLRITTGAFPHSDIRGASVVCTFPRLFAAYHVLLRLPVPRHPPYALSCLICFSRFAVEIAVYLLTSSAFLYTSRYLAFAFFVSFHHIIQFSRYSASFRGWWRIRGSNS